MKSFVITPLVNPTALITEISLHCSYKFPVIEEDREKKQINIVMEMTTLKIISSVFSAYTDKEISCQYLCFDRKMLFTYVA